VSVCKFYRNAENSGKDENSMCGSSFSPDERLGAVLGKMKKESRSPARKEREIKSALS
jgi:hypothetical protein